MRPTAASCPCHRAQPDLSHGELCERRWTLGRSLSSPLKRLSPYQPGPVRCATSAGRWCPRRRSRSIACGRGVALECDRRLVSPGHPVDDATKTWPPDRRQVDVGTLTNDRAKAKETGACCNVTFDLFARPYMRSPLRKRRANRPNQAPPGPTLPCASPPHEACCRAILPRLAPGALADGRAADHHAVHGYRHGVGSGDTDLAHRPA